MDLIETLSEGLADELREKRKGKLQRTFVAASDAAEAKAKRCMYNVTYSKILDYHLCDFINFRKLSMYLILSYAQQ